MTRQPIGLDATGTRQETDSLGTIDVPAGHYWGAQTERSLRHFDIGGELMPAEIPRAYGIVKQAAARVNAEFGLLTEGQAGAIEAAAAEVASGALDGEFPLFLWQTGSGTQTNMNVNEVIANRCAQVAGAPLGGKRPIHPNDHVNMSQSSNDTFPTAMHVATVTFLDDHLLASLRALSETIERKSALWADVVKIGRTHLQDAVPLSVGQEWSGYARQFRDTERDIVHARSGLLELAAGGTAVGTGLNAPRGFGEAIAAEIASLTGKPFVTAANKFAAIGSLDAMVRAHASLRGLAVSLMKFANDIRWLASGPRCGLGELRLPENEPGSSIMPGKVNPTLCESAVMVAIQVIGNDTAVAFAGSQGNFELNAMRPVVIGNMVRSARILADVMDRLRVHSIEGAELDTGRIAEHVERSLMLVTALSPAIGYDRASAIAHDALRDGLTLREAALRDGVDAGVFDRLVDAGAMIG